MNRVKLAPRRAQTAADALFRIHDGHTAAEGGFSLGVDDVWRFCEEYNLDMIVMLEQMACKAVTTWHGIYEEEAAKRGIHVIWIPHALLDPRKADRQSMRDEVNRYMRTVLGEEPFDPSLENIEDQNAW